MGSDRQNLFKKDRARRKKREEEIRSHREVTWLLLSEGGTEVNYFNELVNYLNSVGTQKIKLDAHGLGHSPKGVVDKTEHFFGVFDKLCKKKRIPYAKIIFAFDKDSFDDFNDAIFSANKRYPDCIVAWSNECFELWLRLHFEDANTGQNRWQHYDKMTKIFRSKGIFSKDQNYKDHGKSLPNILETINKCGGSYEKAIHRAKNLLNEVDLKNPANANPATMVFEAVEAIIAESQSS